MTDTPRTRRSAIPVEERLADLGRRIYKHQEAIANLQAQSKDIVEAYRAKAQAMLDALPPRPLAMSKELLDENPDEVPGA